MTTIERRAAGPEAKALRRINAVLLCGQEGPNPLPQLLARGLENANVRVRFKTKPSRAFRKPPTDGRLRVLHVHWLHAYLYRQSLAGTLRSGMRFFGQLLGRKRRGVRLVWTAHDLYFAESKHPRAERLLQALMLRVVDGCIVGSESAAAYVSEGFHLPVDRLSVIPHANYADWYPNDVSRSDARAQLGIPQHHKVFLSFGSVRAYKGLPQLFEAFRRLRSDGVTLVVAGWPYPNEMAGSVLAMAERDPRVRAFPRWIKDDEVQLFFNSADAFVLPVRYGSTAASGSIGLAATFGRAVIAPDQEWILDPMPREGSIVYDRRQPDALRNALERALEADLATMGERNREHIMQWSWDRIGLLTRQVYEGQVVKAIP